MSNIHRIGDLNNPQQPNGNDDECEQLKRLNIPFFDQMNIQNPQIIKNPRDESFSEMLTFLFCPRIRLFSFTSFMISILWIIFGCTCLQGLQVPGSLLQIKLKVLEDDGASWPLRIYYQCQFYRWFTAIFLHASFLHIAANSFGLLIIGSAIEASLGAKNTAIIYIVSGILGNIFSSVVIKDPNHLSLGASACIFGIFAYLISFFILNWQQFSFMSEQSKCQMICCLVMILSWIFLFNTGSQPGNVDAYGHLGGFISGLLLGLIIPTPISQGEYEKNVKIVATVFIVLFSVLCLVLFYFVKFTR